VRDRAGTAAIAANFDLLHDEKVGIVAHLGEITRISGAPDFIHFAARTADPGALGGARGPFLASAAGADREAAASRAVQRALARYSAALYERDGLPFASYEDATFRCMKPPDFAIYSNAQYARPGFPYVPFDEDTPLRWSIAVDLATGEEIHVPAPFVWFPYPYLREAGDLPIVPPTVSGLACREGVAAAALAGLLEVVARDALAIFWQSMTAPPQLRMEALPDPLASLVGRFQATGDRMAILDITTNNRLASFAVVVSSAQPERPAFAVAAASGLDPVAAIAEALSDLADARRLGEETKRRRTPPSPANQWEDVVEAEDHLAFAANHANRELIAFMTASEDRRTLADYDNPSAGSVDADLEMCVSRVVATGHRAYAANLTSEDIGVLGLNVCRAIVPGYQPVFAGHRLRALGGDRLYDVPQKLGYRGVLRGSAGNPAPFPFL
jgi:ribosomal protein S12 methylthiotransferase accessory factor